MVCELPHAEQIIRVGNRDRRRTVVAVRGSGGDERRGLHLRELVKSIPANRLMIETDAPFLSPEPHRAKRPCLPSMCMLTSRAWPRCAAIWSAAWPGSPKALSSPPCTTP